MSFKLAQAPQLTLGMSSSCGKLSLNLRAWLETIIIRALLIDFVLKGEDRSRGGNQSVAELFIS